MRLKIYPAMVALTLAGLSLLSISPARAQEQTEVLMPEQSAAKAKDLIQKAVQALGGSEYLAVRDATCSGRIGSFGHSGDLMGYEKFIDYSKLPDKDRSENLPKRNIIEIKNGDKGWVLDRGGVSEADEVSIAEFQEDIKTDIDNVLRDRWKEPGTILRYLGPDVVDLKEADWIEFVDNDNRSIRIAFAKATHLPLRKVLVTRDPGTRMRSETIEYYSNYHPIGGVIQPFQVTRERNGQKIYQAFIEECKFNTNPSDSLFTKESLEERWAQVGKKEIKKQEKQKQKQEQSDRDEQKNDDKRSGSSTSSSSSN
ncbi:MAG TPA: hypothetical protein VLW83_13560 [Candidatus Acidoferrales bacterium]|nr:hypothetical protein [Candidatus Acidoferrales bacterium]